MALVDLHQPLTIGLISYFNCAPFNHTLPQLLPECRFVYGTPNSINDGLLAGDIDLGLISSYSFGSHLSRFLMLPDLGISCFGAVRSVLLLSRFPDPADLHDRPLALTTHSQSSVQLLKLLFANHYRATPRYVRRPSDPERMLADHDGALVIGDDALLEYHRCSTGCHIIDIAAEWTIKTGYPFVFAVWVVQRRLAGDSRLAGIYRTIVATREKGMAAIDDLAAAHAERSGLSLSVCSSYLHGLNYRLGPRELDGLGLFFRLSGIEPEHIAIWDEGGQKSTEGGYDHGVAVCAPGA